MPKNRNYFIIATVIVVSTISFLQYGCKHDPEVFSDVCFESEILPVFQNNCTKAGCHNPEDRQSDIVLNTYENIMAAGITAGNAKKSKVYKALSGGVEPMPPKRRLTGNQIALIYSWIQGGAQNTTGCGCDTSAVTYSSTIAPIFSNYCALCHGTDSIANFSNYASLNSYLDTNTQKMINDINFATGASPMPPAAMLGGCDIKKITKWIHDGHLNN
jgi:mono/diheme cytochrome c family protein